MNRNALTEVINPEYTDRKRPQSQNTLTERGHKARIHLQKEATKPEHTDRKRPQSQNTLTESGHKARIH